MASVTIEEGSGTARKGDLVGGIDSVVRMPVEIESPEYIHDDINPIAVFECTRKESSARIISEIRPK